MPGVNAIAVLVAGVAGWLVGAIWYGVLGRPWRTALGWSEADLRAPDGKRRVPVTAMTVALFAQIVMALILAGMIGRIGPPSVIKGIVSGALIWLGFVMTTLAVNNAFQRKSPLLTLIDGGHWFTVLVVQGIVIGLFG
jgi:fatty acid desaturase